MLHHQCWIPAGTPLGYFIVALSHGDPVALVLQDQPPHMLQQFIDVADVGEGQCKAMGLGLGSS